MKYINNVLLFTDIHWGAQNNEERHNIDCLEFINWVCEQTKTRNIEGIVFLGDWYENRNAINGQTLDYSYRAVKLLNNLNIPVFFIIGNHDLYFRHNRSIFTTNIFETLKNFTIIDNPKEITNLGPKGSLISPYLFHSEYPILLNYNHLPVWFLHAEFNGFVITGDSLTMKHGTDVENFNKPKKIFSGHFHKRQNYKNCHYIGNPFATTFADANDENKGIAIYNFDLDEITYVNYNGPSFITTKLSELKKNDSILKINARVKCLADIDINLEDSTNLIEDLTQKYQLRSFIMEEPSHNELLTDTDIDLSDIENIAEETTKSLVLNLLDRIPNENNINSEELKEIYQNLK